MKRNTAGHPKTVDLQLRLGLRKYQVVGVLEAVWHFAAQYAKRGDVGKFTDLALAQGIEWERDPGALVEALVAAGYLDCCACHRLRIHDWPDHADQAVKRSQEVQRHGFLGCYQSSQQEKLAEGTSGADEREALASETRQSVAVAVAGAVAYQHPPPPPPAGGESVDPPGEEPPAGDARDVGEAVEILAAAYIAAGGVADRSWRRRARGELQSRGVVAGCQAVQAWIEAERDERAQAAMDAEWAASKAEAIRWVRDHGGAAVVTRGALDWLGRHREPGEPAHTALERWASEPGIPPGVLSELPGLTVAADAAPPSHPAPALGPGDHLPDGRRVIEADDRGPLIVARVG